MKKLIIIGGKQKRDSKHSEEWSKHEKAMVTEVDLETKEQKVLFEYVSPPEVLPSMDEGSSILFKAGSIIDDKIYLGTTTEAMVYSFPDFKQLDYVSLPCFNDVHHVRPSNNGNLIVVSTGLDTVFEINSAGEIIEEWNTVGEDTWERFSKDIDYRKVHSTKPHHSHPNFSFYLDDKLWVTRFEQKDAVNITDFNDTISIGLERVHDGILYDKYIYFTTVDGKVVKVDKTTKKIVKVTDLRSIEGDLRKLGWCRGLAVINEDSVIVGFTGLRMTKITKNLDWLSVKGVKDILKSITRQPARVVKYDLRNEKKVWEVSTEEVNMDAIFSLHLV